MSEAARWMDRDESSQAGRPEATDPSESTEKAAIQMCQAGDISGLEALYSLYSEKVFRTCFRILGDHAAAEDQTHEVFLHVFRKIDRFRGRSTFSTWLYRLTVNQTLNRLRSRKRRLLKMLGVDFVEGMAGKGPAPDHPSGHYSVAAGEIHGPPTSSGPRWLVNSIRVSVQPIGDRKVGCHVPPIRSSMSALERRTEPGSTRSIRRLPRKSSRKKLGCFQSFWRAASAISSDSYSLGLWVPGALIFSALGCVHDLPTEDSLRLSVWFSLLIVVDRALQLSLETTLCRRIPGGPPDWVPLRWEHRDGVGLRSVGRSNPSGIRGLPATPYDTTFPVQQ